MSSSSPTARFPILPLCQEETVSHAVPTESGLSGPESSDENLLSRIAKLDEEALTLLFRRHAPLAREIGRRILRDEGEAEDLVQQVFLYLHDKARVFDSSKSSGRSWIVQNIYYQAINRRRYLSSRHQLFRSTSKISGNPEARKADYGGSETAIFDGALVQEILKILTPEQFETVRLFFFEGYTLAEISEKLGQPLGNVRHHYYRGLNKLRARLFLE
jgi:RNA polymerase sigma-70 factor (ECF subfamily)